MHLSTPPLKSVLLKPGLRAPTFRLLDHHGFTVSLEQQQKNYHGVALLFFPSNFMQADMRLLSDYAKEYAQLQQARVEVMAISGLNWETLHYLAKKLALPYPVLFDPCCRISTFYRAMLIPRFLTGRAVYGVDIRPTHPTIAFSAKYAEPSTFLNYFKN